VERVVYIWKEFCTYGRSSVHMESVLYMWKEYYTYGACTEVLLASMSSKNYNIYVCVYVNVYAYVCILVYAYVYGKSRVYMGVCLPLRALRTVAYTYVYM